MLVKYFELWLCQKVRYKAINTMLPITVPSTIFSLYLWNSIEESTLFIIGILLSIVLIFVMLPFKVFSWDFISSILVRVCLFRVSEILRELCREMFSSESKLIPSLSLSWLSFVSISSSLTLSSVFLMFFSNILMRLLYSSLSSCI